MSQLQSWNTTFQKHRCHTYSDNIGILQERLIDSTHRKFNVVTSLYMYEGLDGVGGGLLFTIH